MGARIKAALLMSVVLLAARTARGDCQVFLDCSLCNGYYEVIACTDTNECATVDCGDGDCSTCAYCDSYCTNGGEVEHLYSCTRTCPLAPSTSGVAAARESAAVETVSVPTVPTASYTLPATLDNSQSQGQPRISTNASGAIAETVQIVQVSAGQSPTGLGNLRYVVRNLASSPLVAYRVDWTTYVGERRGITVSNVSDLWVAGGIPPGGTTSAEVGGFVSSSGEPVTALVGTISYAEFADGTRLGPDADQTFSYFNEKRAAKLAAYQKLSPACTTGGLAACLRALEQEAKSGNAAERGAAFQISRLLKQKGAVAASAEVARVSGLQIPQ
jgi:hypothetical protein